MRATDDRPSIDNWPPRSPISLSPGIAWWLLAFIGPHLPNGIAVDWRVMSPTGWLLTLSFGGPATATARTAHWTVRGLSDCCTTSACPSAEIELGTEAGI